MNGPNVSISNVSVLVKMLGNFRVSGIFDRQFLAESGLS